VLLHAKAFSFDVGECPLVPYRNGQVSGCHECIGCGCCIACESVQLCCAEATEQHQGDDAHFFGDLKDALEFFEEFFRGPGLLVEVEEREVASLSQFEQSVADDHGFVEGVFEVGACDVKSLLLHGEIAEPTEKFAFHALFAEVDGEL
jgi:hypothetical protein